MSLLLRSSALRKLGGAAAPRADRRLTPWTFVLAFLVFQVAFYYAYRYGMSFSQAVASPFWFPDSVLLCALLLSPPRVWAIFVLGALPIRVFSEVARDIPLWFLLSTYAIDSVRGVLTALILRRVLKNPLRFETVQEFASSCGPWCWFRPLRPWPAHSRARRSVTRSGRHGSSGFSATRSLTSS